MDRRLELDAVLNAIPGVQKAYFEPPGGSQMKYPCIVYSMSQERVRRADDSPYAMKRGYTVTVIDEDPDSEIVGHVSKMRYCRFDRHYFTDNLHHWVYTLFY